MPIAKANSERLLSVGILLLFPVTRRVMQSVSDGRTPPIQGQVRLPHPAAHHDGVWGRGLLVEGVHVVQVRVKIVHGVDKVHWGLMLHQLRVSDQPLVPLPYFRTLPAHLKIRPGIMNYVRLW